MNPHHVVTIAETSERGGTFEIDQHEPDDDVARSLDLLRAADMIEAE